MTPQNPSPVSADQAVRNQLVALIEGGHAHQPFDATVEDVQAPLRGIKPDGLPYSIWQLVEHIRIAQRDILDFSRDPDYQSPPWPDGYWPAEAAPADDAAWQTALAQIREDRDAFLALINDPAQDLYAPFAHGTGQNLLREALLIGDHTSYHTGQILILRRLLNDWPE